MLDFFCTPPWATRALFPLLGKANRIAWEPACGEGHMAEVLKEHFGIVRASDVRDYGRGYMAVDFLNDNVLVIGCDWIITNPPFNLALPFAERALTLVEHGVALLVRTQWLEGRERYERLFSRKPPTTVAIFSERVPMVEGRWDPEATTATSYAWVIWDGVGRDLPYATQLRWIPPGRRRELTRPDDAERFAGKKENRDGDLRPVEKTSQTGS